ncbi:hypothetical protein PBY51_003774 [Eleginops maclovinus]|uniref:RING-type domain-containing protein n=1 Tax=Eleginops maclovinus TaxID=56733 RepID=A0AAN7Y1G2_ELEMC|nr:hypothetical protein PBY51_003774 [Eleginops maclovinus]
MIHGFLRRAGRARLVVRETKQSRATGYSKTTTVRPEDLKTEKIAVIFQVQKDTIYLTDDHNIAIFPEENGHFISVDLVDRGHYEVHGDASASAAAAPPPPPATATAAAADQRPRYLYSCAVTVGSNFWKQNSRKTFAVPEIQLGQLGKRRRLSCREDTGLQDVVAEIEEVIEAAQGLKEVTKSIKEVTEGTGKATLLCLQEGEVNALKTVFGCLVCPGPVEKPIFSSCCRSIIGCRSCIQQWEHSHDYCPKCRCQDRETNEVDGLDEALAVLRKLF